MSRPKRIADASLADRLEYAAGYACDSACEGRCHVCPAEVMREAAKALRAADQPSVVHEKSAVVDAAHQYDPIRAFAEGEAEGDCSYGDNCPPVARHYRCVSCKARLALVNADRVAALRELTRQSQELGLYDTTTVPTNDVEVKP